MAAPEPGGRGGALAFAVGALLVVILAAALYVVFGIGSGARRIHVAINAPSARSLARRIPLPAPGPPRTVFREPGGGGAGKG